CNECAVSRFIQPSPTTGTLPLPSFRHESAVPILATSNTEREKSEDFESSFMFKPYIDTPSLQCLSVKENLPQNVVMTDVNHQALIQMRPPVSFDRGFLKQTTSENYGTGSPSDIIVSSNCTSLQRLDAGVATDQALQQDKQMQLDDRGSQQILEGDQRGAYPPMGPGRPSEDGYNWRKYGQKQVKGSEYPRSYYKCTHPNCQVKKKIERSHDGQITEIIYKGAHNHPKPQPSRRSTLGSAFSVTEMAEAGDGHGSYVKVEGGSAWINTSHGYKDNKVNSDWRGDGTERTSSTSVLTDLSDPLSTAQGKQLGILESADTPELSSTLASHDEEEDRATQGSISLGDDADDDETDSKRRRIENSLIETNMASRTLREPRVVVQTESIDNDILDDGYRWRKYGQKVVKGNPNPRSYYKCTSAGCGVRKHVERASHDLKYVITTYEGKHNHEVPAARNSNHLNNSSGGSGSQGTSNANISRNSNHIPKPEPHIQDFMPRFERKPELRNDYFKTGNLRGFPGDMKFGPSVCYDMKLPPFQPAMCGSFGLNIGSHNEPHQGLPEFPISLPMNLPLSANMGLTGYDYNNHGRPIGLLQSSFHGDLQQLQQQPKEAVDIRFLRPKQEQRDDVGFENQQLSMNQLANASPSVYHHMMGGGYPL
ncbi:hypothetical protein GIB67_010076, partial [Kingdonia uniflora]